MTPAQTTVYRKGLYEVEVKVGPSKSQGRVIVWRHGPDYDWKIQHMVPFTVRKRYWWQRSMLRAVLAGIEYAQRCVERDMLAAQELAMVTEQLTALQEVLT